MKRLCRLIGVLVFPVLLGCAGQNAALKPIQQQRSGDYQVTLLNDTGVVKQRANKLTLEIRQAATNELVKVNNLQVQARMLMPGMGPMFGEVSSVRELAPGRYEFDANFAMMGQWTCLVTFDPNGRAQFSFSAQ
jgi:hypothetical protein